MSTRRRLLFALTAAALAAPLCATAQQPGKVWRVGILVGRGREDNPLAYIVPALRDLGYVEGKNLVVEARFAYGDYRRLPELAAEVVRLHPDVIIAADGSAAAFAARKATTTIPIVFAMVGDPVGTGLVTSLAHPGGNATGVSNIAPVVTAKQIEMLVSLVPRITRLALLTNPANPNTPVLLESVRAGARKMSVTLSTYLARTSEEIDDAFSQMRTQRPDVLVVGGDSFIEGQGRQIAHLCATLLLPSSSMHRSYSEAGGLMSYGASRTYTYIRAAAYVDKIFKGAMPGDLPIEQPTKYELVINRKTAKALGLEIPPDLLVLADKVIE